MKKRVLAIAMTLAMTLSLLPVSALATETGETPEEETSPVNSIQETNSSEKAENQDQELTADVENDEDTQVTVGDSVENPVVTMDGKGYASLADAVAAVHELTDDARMQEHVIELQRNASGGGSGVGYANTKENSDGTITTSGNNPVNITFDLNDFTYTVTNPTSGSSGTETNGFQLLQNSIVTFKNGTLFSELGNIVIQNYSNLTLDDVTIEAQNAGYVVSNNCGNINFKGNTSITAGPGNVAFDVCSFANYPGVTVNVDTTGTITGKIEITRSDGNNGEGNLLIKDGTFEGTISNSDSRAQVEITGGIFDSDVSKYIPSGMKQENGEVVIDNEKAVASVNGVGYGNLQEAVDAVTMTNQTTIKLLKSTSGAGVKVDGTVKRNLTFDLGGHTYTITSGVGSTGTETNGFQLIKDNNITITNGTITAAPAEGRQVKILIQNYSNLTLENVTLDGRGMTDYNGLNYTLSNNNGEITLKSGTVIQARADEIAMDVCWAESYQDGARVTVEEGAEIQGTVELGLWGQDAYSNNQSVLTVNGGTITGEVKLDSSISEDKISETIESLKTNVTINGGTFGSNVDAYVDSNDDANAHIARNGQYTYYETVQDALNAAQPGDSVVALNSAPDSTLCTVTLNYGYNSNRATIQVASGTEISLPAPGTRTGYTFNGWYNGSSYVGREGTEVTITSDMIFTASWTPIQSDRPSSGSSGSSSSDSGDYLISVDRVSGGRVTVQPGRADKGDTVTITVYPNDGYELDELVVTDSRGNEIDLDARGSNRFTFTMPGGKVTVEASFIREGGQTQTPQTTFADVPASAWYYDAVEYVYENGLMSGVSGGRFAPDDTLTRAMLVQTLYAMEGRPAAASAGFADVASGDWYASAVNWAAANGVVSGVSETGFGPNNALTREQLALILYRFAQYKGYDVTGTSDLAAYADGSSVSSWAAEAMGWAVDAGLISGVGGNQIAPTGTASRAQVAQILMNFCENVAR